MKIGGSLIQYYIFCKRRCYLHAYNIKSEHTSDLVKLGKYYHQEFEEGAEEDKIINGVKIDKIEGDYLVELKKSNADCEAAKWQLLFYLYKLKEVGIIKKGKLKFKDNRDDIETELTEENEKELLQIISEIEKLLKQDEIPPVINNRKCKKCAFYEFCYS
jgi:CRISPR-associated exonuclease Cas4